MQTETMAKGTLKHVASRYAQLGEDIYTCDGWFWWVMG